ncbi:hypothetical protein B0T09DRAFT_351314 [Sordaria sp. MPI-SDFR-AT-0083]|nr:hypothetical protein B0T09DRAFT_351314 [Sordaria sp. MPI-SDFR-AT-0083]
MHPQRRPSGFTIQLPGIRCKSAAYRRPVTASTSTFAAQRQFRRLQQLQGVDCHDDRWAGMLSRPQPFYG